MQSTDDNSLWSVVLFVATALPLTLGLVGCGNECDFHERCNGNVREICGGVDKVANRKVESIACEGVNAVCVEIGQDELTPMCRGPGNRM